jgi:hypothetical protein
MSHILKTKPSNVALLNISIIVLLFNIINRYKKESFIITLFIVFFNY